MNLYIVVYKIIIFLFKLILIKLHWRWWMQGVCICFYFFLVYILFINSSDLEETKSKVTKI